jgi:hypothetical protein
MVTFSQNCLSKNGVYIRLDKANYTVDEKPVLTIKNSGPNEITFGVDYEIYMKVGEDWVEVPALGPNTAWTAALCILPHCKSYRQLIDLSRFGPGDYRVFKTVRDEVTGVSTTFVVKFKIIK